MRALDIDFMPPSRLLRRSAWALILCGAISVAVLAVRDVGTFTELRRVEADNTALSRRLTGERATVAAATASALSVPVYFHDAKEMERFAAFDTASVLTTIESGAIPGVRVNVIELSTSSADARVEIEAADFGQTLEYLDALNTGMTGRPWTIARTQASASGQTATLQSPWTPAAAAP